MSELTPRERVSYAIKLLLASALHYAGVLHLIRRITLRKKAVVLMYHRVLTPEQRRRTASQPGLVVEDTTFARQVEVLKRHFTVITLDQFEDRLLNNRPFDDASCLITFDDGWIDNYENALPVLRAKGVPAVVFLAVNFIGHRRLFTREALTHLVTMAIGHCRTHPDRAPVLRRLLEPLRLERALDIADPVPLQQVKVIIESHKYANGPEYESLVCALVRELGVSEAELSDLDTFIDWAQVDAMRRSRVVFGGHGADHRVLTQVSPEVVHSEVQTSFTTIKARLGTTARSFAYPGGGWNATVAAEVRQAGYQLAFTIEPGFVSAGDDRFCLRRINIHEGMTRSTPMFMARLSGLF
jgi:peptidoglycan/xylan/chitin deacetylase (PgdA/CDA1 family)